MSVVSGPRVSQNGMIMCVDAGNKKSFTFRPRSGDHGISEWACMESGTATLSVPYPSTTIYRLDTAQNLTAVYTGNVFDGAVRTTLAVTAGNTYWATKPVHMLVEGAGSCLVPLSLKGKTFGRYNVRYGDSTFFFYPLYEDAIIRVYDNTPDGINGTVTTTINVPRRTVGTWSTTTEPGFAYFVSDVDIVMSGREGTGVGTDSDFTIIPPASNRLYKRPAAFPYTVTGGTPSFGNAYYSYDPNVLCFAQNIGDGSGGDSAFGIPTENLSDRAVWGNAVSDYQVVSPYNNTIVSYYYDFLLNRWNVWDTHVLTGTLDNPGAAFRTGTDGPGVESDQSLDYGAPTTMQGGANLWKWEGTAPFHLIINDTLTDEEPILGWMSDVEEGYTYNTDRTFADLSNRINSVGNGSIIGEYSNPGNGIVPDVNTSAIQILDDGQVRFDDYDIGSNGITIEVVYKVSQSDNLVGFSRIFDYGDTTISLGPSNTPPNTLRAWTDGGGSRAPEFQLPPDSSPRFWDNHHHFVVTYDKSNMTCYWNVDTVFSSVDTGDLDVSSTSDMSISNENAYGSPFGGQIFITRVYNRALSAEEVEQHFYSLKSRYSLEREQAL